jgi:predicted GNAT family acetyltransferase
VQTTRLAQTPLAPELTKVSLYSQYIREKTYDHILETETGFATYRFVDEKTVYIVDVFIISEFRKLGQGSDLADRIAKEAKRKGCNKLIASVIPSAKNSTDSLEVLLAYGMTLKSANQDFVLFEKEI